MIKLFLLCLLFGLSSPAVTLAETQSPPQKVAQVYPLTIPAPEESAPDKHNDYFEKLLSLALGKSAGPHEAFQLIHNTELTGKERLRAALKADKGVDVIWSSTNRERESELRAIRINLFKGINEYRLLMIRAGEEDRFAGIQTLDDLRHFRAGTGSYWQDTAVLKANNLPYVTSWNYTPMFRMLAARRFDYMSRGANEIWSELDLHADLNLTQVPGILLRYPLPIYFFVHPKNEALAKRIETGLNMALEDGSFDELFFSIPGHQRAWDEIHHGQRRVIELQATE